MIRPAAAQAVRVGVRFGLDARRKSPEPCELAISPWGFLMLKVNKWHTAATLALVAARIAVPVLAAIAAGARWDVALLAALGVEAGASASKP